MATVAFVFQPGDGVVTDIVVARYGIAPILIAALSSAGGRA
jgi:hypothetical protein